METERGNNAYPGGQCGVVFSNDSDLQKHKCSRYGENTVKYVGQHLKVNQI